jgi:hypothetical protein
MSQTFITSGFRENQSHMMMVQLMGIIHFWGEGDCFLQMIRILLQSRFRHCFGQVNFICFSLLHKFSLTHSSFRVVDGSSYHLCQDFISLKENSD